MGHPITVIGIGGMAGNFLNGLASKEPGAYPMLAINTDEARLSHFIHPDKLLIGYRNLKGIGARGQPELGKAAAAEGCNEIDPYLLRAERIVFVAGLGGGTGSGALPFLVNRALTLSKSVSCVVTTPFQFEGADRDNAAKQALSELNALQVPTRIFDNQMLFTTMSPNATFADAFDAADETMCSWIRECDQPTQAAS